MQAITLDVSALGEVSSKQLYRLAQSNDHAHFEQTHKGELVIMLPVCSESGGFNAYITTRLFIWNEKKKLGKVFDSSTGFTLPNGATRSPDSRWIVQERWDNLTKAEKSSFAPICPDFIIELMSSSDRLKEAQDKMIEWRNNGCRLGWLIDTKHENVYIYRDDGSISVLESFDEVAKGEDVLPDFELILVDLR